MNRIILIGNGFDLAHGMKTNYRDFIDDYWKSTITSIKESEPNRMFENKEIKINMVPTRYINGFTYNKLKECLNEFKSRIEFKNTFLQTITEKISTNNWVHIENEYYFQLKESINKTENINRKNEINKLNKDFEEIKLLLQKYLIKVVDDFFKNNLEIDLNEIKKRVGYKIYQPFKPKDFSEEFLNYKSNYEYNRIKQYLTNSSSLEYSEEKLDEKTKKLVERISASNNLVEIKKILKSDLATEYFDLSPRQTIFLNFNYTNTQALYKNPLEFDFYDDITNTYPITIHIHGSIYPQEKNPIIFGFGDELDEDYKLIENLDDNDLLENIKSINYLNTDKYKNLLEIINSDFFQINIFGHSCGITDRTLLNTIFEHENCISIKTFYHNKNNNSDNYSDIIRNISRNFNDKAKMRDRVVNKTFCEPLL